MERVFQFAFAAAVACSTCTAANGVEGLALAGPIGGVDIAAARLPPAGLYGGLGFATSEARNFYDGNGHLVPALTGLDFKNYLGGAFLLYVPDFQVLGGSIGVWGDVIGSGICGHASAGIPKRCADGIDDPYFEVDWSRFFGKLRPSRYPGALPIAEGLTVAVGFGALVPVGKYNVLDAAQGLIIGNNIWDFAPTVAFTYMTPPILAEGTQIDARLYWNNYLENPKTHYLTGDVLVVDFAVTERIGKFQGGLAGVYGVQVGDDKLFGVRVPPDGRRVEALALGGVLGYDMPEYGAFAKIKVLTAIFADNGAPQNSLVLIFAKKL